MPAPQQPAAPELGATAEPAAPATTASAAGRDPPMPAPPPPDPARAVVPPVLDLPYAVDDLEKAREEDPDRWGGKTGRAKAATSANHPGAPADANIDGPDGPAGKAGKLGKPKAPKQRKKPSRNFKVKNTSRLACPTADLFRHW